MTEQEIQKSVAAFGKKRPIGTDAVISSLKVGTKFQFKEIERECLCEIIFRSADFFRYEKEGWKHTIQYDHPSFNKIVEIYP